MDDYNPEQLVQINMSEDDFLDMMDDLECALENFSMGEIDRATLMLKIVKAGALILNNEVKQ